MHARLTEIRDLLAEIRDGMIDMERAPPPAPAPDDKPRGAKREGE